MTAKGEKDKYFQIKRQTVRISPFAKDIDVYRTDVEDERALAPSRREFGVRREFSDECKRLFFVIRYKSIGINNTSSNVRSKQTKEKAFYAGCRDLFGHASWQAVQARLWNYADVSWKENLRDGRSRERSPRMVVGKNSGMDNSNASDLGVRGPRLKRPTHKAWILSRTTL